MTEIDGIDMVADRPLYWCAIAELAASGRLSKQWAEFGVAGGRSCHFWLDALPEGGTLHCFDSWRGLPEPWNKGTKVMPAGTFAQPIPQFLIADPRARIVEGFVEQTLPYDFGAPLQFCHIDTDIYSAADTILRRVDDYLVDGTVIVFDEMWDNWKDKYPLWREGEFRAYSEWKARTGKSVEWFLATIGGSAGYVRAGLHPRTKGDQHSISDIQKGHDHRHEKEPLPKFHERPPFFHLSKVRTPM